MTAIFLLSTPPSTALPHFPNASVRKAVGGEAKDREKEMHVESLSEIESFMSDSSPLLLLLLLYTPGRVFSLERQACKEVTREILFSLPSCTSPGK